MNNNFPKMNNLANMMGVPQMQGMPQQPEMSKQQGMNTQRFPIPMNPMGQMPMGQMPMGPMGQMGQNSQKQAVMNLREENNVKENNMQYYEPMKGRLYDSDSNLNYANVHNPMTSQVNFSKLIKSYLKESRNFWLESYWKDLYNYVTLNGNKARLIKNKNEYKKEKKNVYSGFSAKTQFLRDEFLDKANVKKILKKAVKKIAFTDNYNYENTVRKYVHHQVKKNIISKIKESM